MKDRTKSATDGKLSMDIGEGKEEGGRRTSGTVARDN
jgi:hypothetical protein